MRYLVLSFFLILFAAPVSAQTAQSAPDTNTQARLVWTTLIALDNANRTGNYEVLYALGSPGFQQRNSPDALAASFAPLRQSRIDVGRSILVSPTYYIPPAVDGQGHLRLRGAFEFRPRSIRFDMIFTQVGNGWRLHALSVVEADASSPR